MSWKRVLSQDELPDGEKRTVKAGGQDILLIHDRGTLYAVGNACPHLRLPLQGGKVTEDGAIVCRFHHSAFDLKSGDVKAWSPWPPGVGRMLGTLSQEKALTTYPVRVENDSIWIEIESEE